MAGLLSHRQRVCRLYKKALRQLESWVVFRDEYRFEAVLLRERFECNKSERNMVRATRLLVDGEQEVWLNQHPQPYIFPEAPGGTMYQRFECYKVPEGVLNYWHPSEKAMYPDYFAKREQWKQLRLQSWENEVKQLAAETPAEGPSTEVLPPARKDGQLPPLWWSEVTRAREMP